MEHQSAKWSVQGRTPANRWEETGCKQLWPALSDALAWSFENAYRLSVGWGSRASSHDPRYPRRR
jgi:hypothetical protein